MSATTSASDSRPRRLWPWLVALVVLFGVDAARPPEHQVSAGLAIVGINLYQATLSSWLGATGVVCRFEEPTCSHYGEEAIRRHGIVRGSWLAARRVARCGPWTQQGSVDRVPGRK